VRRISLDPAGRPNTVTDPDRVFCTPTMHLSRVDLPAPRRTEQPGDPASLDLAGQAGQHDATTADDTQIADLDGDLHVSSSTSVIHQVMGQTVGRPDLGSQHLMNKRATWRRAGPIA